MRAGGWQKAGLLVCLLNFQNILQVPFVKQEKFYCAASCLAMIRLYWGEAVTQYEIAEKAGWREDRGLTIGQIEKYLDTLPAYRYRMGRGDAVQLKAWLGSGYPVIVALQGSSSDIKHAVVLIGFDEDIFICHDPGRGEKIRLSFEKMMKDWKASDYFYCLLVPRPTEPDLRVTATPSRGPDR